MGISAALKLTIYGSDILDAYAHSEAPGISTFLKIDDAYADWWKTEDTFYLYCTVCKVIRCPELSG